MYLSDSASQEGHMIEFLRAHPLLLVTGMCILGTGVFGCAWVLRSRRRSRQLRLQARRSVQAFLMRLTAKDIAGDPAPKSESLDSGVAARNSSRIVRPSLRVS